MKLRHFSALLAATALLATACKREAEVTVDNPLLAYVPADTPYVYANLEPTPAEVTDAFLLRAEPFLETVKVLAGDLEIEINSEHAGEFRYFRLLSALWAEFEGKNTREGIESIGLSTEAMMTVYGMGAFPVVRISLKDPAVFRETITRIEARSGITFTSHDLGASQYWKMASGPQGLAAYFAIVDDHFALSLFPSAAEAAWLPSFLGQTMPAGSAMAERLAQLNQDKGYTNFGSGIFDLQSLATEFMDETSTTGSLLASMGHGDLLQWDAQCKAELRGMIAKAPRIVAGTTEFSADRIGISYQLELAPGLAARLMELVARVPVANSDPDTLFTAALGLKVGKVRDFALEKATAITTAPFQCENLQGLNHQAQALVERLSMPMMPFINNLKGFRVSLDEFDPENFSPATARGLFTLEMEKPQMVIGMAQMMVPGLAELQLEPGADPVELPQELLSLSADGMHVFAAMGKDSIGVALGQSKQAELSKFMEGGATNGNVFFSVEYDIAAQLELQDKVQRRAAAERGVPVDEYEELILKMRAAYMSLLGRNRLEMHFDEAGIRIDSSMSFN